MTVRRKFLLCCEKPHFNFSYVGKTNTSQCLTRSDETKSRTQRQIFHLLRAFKDLEIITTLCLISPML